jgi:predicted small secreted protein
MKKLLLVLMVVALASFLFVGCVPTTTPAEGEGEGETEVGICPTVSVTSQQAVGTKTYIKGGKQTITVTFAVPTEPVAVYVGSGLKSTPTGADEVVMYTTDKMVYTGDYKTFGVGSGDCGEAYIYVDACLECDYCKYPYTVDTTHPYAKIKVTADICSCEGIALTFASTTNTGCEDTTCCDDECSGFASWAIDLYSSNPFDECCNTPCKTPDYSCSGVGCPVDCVTDCLPEGENSASTYVKDGYYVVTTLLDEVGNQARYYTTLEPFDADFYAKVEAANKLGNVTKVELVEYLQDKIDPADVGDDGVCSWFCGISVGNARQ